MTGASMQFQDGFRRVRRLLTTAMAGLLIVASVAGAFLLRFEYAVPKAELRHLWMGALLALVIKSVVFRLTGSDRGGWRYAGLHDVHQLLIANIVGSFFWSAAVVSWVGPTFPRSIYLLDFVLCLLATIGARVAVRSYYETGPLTGGKGAKKRILIY